MRVVRVAIALAVPVALAALSACKTPKHETGATVPSDAGSDAPLDASPAPSPADASDAAIDAPDADLVLEPEAPTSKVPIVACRDPEEFACCTEKGLDAVVRMAKNRTLNECARVRVLRGYADCPTFFRRGFNAATESCVFEAMNRTLDRRLFALKKANPEQFRTEMALQKTFREVVAAFCGRHWALEPSTGSFTRTSDCMMGLYAYRATQAERINAAELTTAGDGAPRRPSTKVLAPFAEKLCKMPAAIWKGRAVPERCEEQVKREMETAVEDPDKED